MTFAQLRTQYQHLPFVYGRDVAALSGNPQVVRNQFSRWEKKGLLIKLRKGMYLLNPNDRKFDVDPNLVANMLYEPSYLSLEYALSFYGFIPEAVSDVTSITTRKTKQFSNAMGNFVYRTVKPQVFRGFKKVADSPKHFFMAEPEKAVLDFFYLNLGKLHSPIRETLERSYRFQNIEGLNPKRFLELAGLFKTKKLTLLAHEFASWISEAKND